MDAIDLGWFGRLLFGEQWQHAMARATGYSVRSIVNYSGGVRPIPPEMWRKLLVLMREHLKQVGDARRRLELHALAADLTDKPESE